MESPTPNRVRCNLTLDPDFVAEVREVTSNLSQFLEDAGKKEIKRLRLKEKPKA